jgi:predicted metalloprotease with PDZ domain
MTEATTVLPTKLNRIAPKIQYQVAMPAPESHLFEITLQVSDWHGAVLDLKFPVWTPGSYLVREYAKHLQDFGAVTADGHPLTECKLSKNHWHIDTKDVSDIVVKYRIFANELSVRTNHLDATHGYFNGAALFFYLPGYEQQPIEVTIVPPKPDWHVATALPPVAGKSNTFIAADFDTLVDSPFEIGTHPLYEFEVLGKPHELAIWGAGNYQVDRMIEDTQKVIEVEADLFGDLPYNRYLFLLHVAAQGYGGLEHKNSCSLLYSRFGFRAEDKYNHFMQLVAHEFLHLWNIKRIRPKELETFDYDQENYTASLWFGEGTTSYYDLLIPYKAGIYDIKAYLKYLSKEISHLQTTPGRKFQPASESSFDAWIKLYRRDANSDNCQISYYLKGEMVSFLLDLLIRERHQNKQSLDHVMRQMWQQFGQAEIGYTPEQLQEVIASIAGMNLDDFFAKYVHATEELPFDQYLEPFGLQLKSELEDGKLPYTGLKVKAEHGREMIKFVEVGSPAQVAGVDAQDELLAIDGMRVSGEQLSDRLKDYQVGDTIHLTIFHQDELRTLPLTLAAPQPTHYQIVAVEKPSDTQQQNFADWLGVPLSAIA